MNRQSIQFSVQYYWSRRRRIADDGQTFQNYRCADGTQFIVGFSNTTSAPICRSTARRDACRRFACRGTLFRRQHHVEDHQDGHHGQAREARATVCELS